MSVLFLLIFAATIAAGSVFPEPRQLRATGPDFVFDSETIIAVPLKPSPSDWKLAHLLSAELADRGISVPTQQLSVIPKNRRAIVMGTSANPLLAAACSRAVDPVTTAEGYTMESNDRVICIRGADERGAFYGFQSLRQLIDGRRMPGVAIRDWPFKPFRGIKLYLPGRDHIPFFKRFVSDFMALYKFNQVIIELNAGMRFDKHPELNAGWRDLGRDMEFTRRDRPTGINGAEQDSVHHDTADGGVLEKAEVADLVAWARDHYIEVTAEIPSLTHSYYLLTRHRELAENAQAEWPDTYCPSNPDVYPLLFDVIDEYLDVIHPALVHMGHDEWRMPWGECPRCRNKDYRELYLQDVDRIHRHLAVKKVRMAIWGDHLMQSIRGADLTDRKLRSGYAYKVPGALTLEQAGTRVPKDILMFNWFWDERSGHGMGEANEVQLERWGFQQVFGNMTPGMTDWERRAARKSILGGAPSAWAATIEFSFGKDLVSEFVGCAEMLWSGKTRSHADLISLSQSMTPDVRRHFRGERPPSDFAEVVPLEIGAGDAKLSELPEVRPGRAIAQNLIFSVTSPVAVRSEGKSRLEWPVETAPIPIHQDAASLVFLHASARPGASTFVYRTIYNLEDTADLLGWYEVTYEDGLRLSIPLRYGVNILSWKRPESEKLDRICYEGDPVAVALASGGTGQFYAFEWRNPRPGKVIRDVRLSGASLYRNLGTTVTPDGNGIVLAGISMVKKRAPAAR